MTRKAPSNTNEAPCAEYEKLLGKSARLGASFAGADEEDREYIADEFASLLSQRVELLGNIERLRTIEDACPLIRTVPEGQQRMLDAEELLERLLSGQMSAEQVKAEKAKPTRSAGPRALSDKESRTVRDACAEIAQANGYSSASSGSSITLRKGDMTFTLKHFAFPSGNGVVAPSRISMMSSWREGGRADSGIFYDDGEWVELCGDPEMQREIDRVIALFR